MMEKYFGHVIKYQHRNARCFSVPTIWSTDSIVLSALSISEPYTTDVRVGSAFCDRVEILSAEISRASAEVEFAVDPGSTIACVCESSGDSSRKRAPGRLH